ncbi:fungal-specific transcription factor domain-containing protein [Aspergillus sergii]|uniref:Fungal-specific transcription factor domain-containing protein n=1 Tax=Aspergillus sergii TaxID=1034303 RepID=A0A5N6X250_9EURO|nr:fungal-specific transcription factor domain-containing protein [Aspergillus sergii]
MLSSRNYLWRLSELSKMESRGKGPRKMNERRSTKSSYRSLREKSDVSANLPITQAILDDSWSPPTNILNPSTTALHETVGAECTAIGTGHIASDFPFGLSEQEQSIVHRMYSYSTGTSTERPNLDCFSSAVAVNPANHELTGLHDLDLEITGDASVSDDDLSRAIQSHEEIIQRDERFQSVDIEEAQWQHDIQSGGGFYADIFRTDNLDPNELDTIIQQLQFPDNRQGMIRRLFVGHTSNILSIRDGGDTMDPWQTFIWPMARDCPALYHALAAMTCAHISKSQQQLNLLGMKHFNLSIQALVTRMDSMPLEAALATRLALAFAESWGCHIPATGITHLNEAKALIQQALQGSFTSGTVNSELECLKFLVNTWLYRNVIARLTCTETTDTTVAEATAIYTCIIPHIDEKEIDPHMGCGTALFPSIGRLVELVRRVRGRPENRNSPAIISQAIEIKMAIEHWASPVDSDNPSSNISDLIQTAEAYRGAALLLLRQAVPELPASCSVSKLAQKTLVFLATTPPSSRAIHAQIFPLMIAGCETFDEDDREWVRQRWEVMSRRLMTAIPDRCRDMTMEVWRRRDEFETRHGLRDLIKAHRPFPIINRRAMDTSTLYDSLRVPKSNIDSILSHEGLVNSSSAETRSGPRSSDFPDSAAFQKGTDPVTRAGFINYTIKGELHWLRVMEDWNWEIMLA